MQKLNPASLKQFYHMCTKLYCGKADEEKLNLKKRVTVISMFLVDSCDVFTPGLIDLLNQPLAA